MGLIHIYCGDGKGKTTASIGLSMRALGNGMRVHFVQLLKGDYTSELNSLKSIPNLTIDRCNKNFGFTLSMDEQSKIDITNVHNKILLNCERLMQSNAIDMLVIDEFNCAYEYNLLDKSIADRIVFNKPSSIELVLTGRNPHEKFIQVADYISEIKSIKHPFNKGILARKGIEY